jgi:hypothetical protein
MTGCGHVAFYGMQVAVITPEEIISAQQIDDAFLEPDSFDRPRPDRMAVVVRSAAPGSVFALSDPIRPTRRGHLRGREVLSVLVPWGRDVAPVVGSTVDDEAHTVCVSCKAGNPVGATFCAGCGAKLARPRSEIILRILLVAAAAEFLRLPFWAVKH